MIKQLKIIASEEKEKRRIILNAKNRAKYQENKEEEKERVRLYRLNNKEKIKAYRKKYNKENSEKHKKYLREYHKKINEKLSPEEKKEIALARKESDRIYRIENKDKIKKYLKRNAKRIAALKVVYGKKRRADPAAKERESIQKKIYFQKNKNILQKKRVEKYRNDPYFHLVQNMRRRLSSLIRAGKMTKITESKAEYCKTTLGIEPIKLIKYIEKQFYPHPKTGEVMSWKNHSFKGWHIDHIKPIAAFELTKLAEQKKCFHYTNLQPLWAEENLSKSDKYL